MSAFERLKEWSERFAATDVIAAETKELLEELEALRKVRDAAHELVFEGGWAEEAFDGMDDLRMLRNALKEAAK